MASVLFSLVVPFIVCFAIVSEVLDFVEGFPPLQGQNVIYTRYVRRRPIPNSNNFVKEVIEVFNTKRRPPPHAFLHDEDLTRFVRCDFDPSMPDCDSVNDGGDDNTSLMKSTSTTTTPRFSTERLIFSDGSVHPSETTSSSTRFSFWKTPTTKMPITTTTSPNEMVSTLSTSTTSTERSSFWWPITAKVTSTTSTTEQNINSIETEDETLPQISSTSLAITSTKTTPQLPDEFDEDKSEPENDNAYDDDTGNENEDEDTGDQNPNEYYETDEAETTEHTVKDTDTKAQSEDTTVKPTKKSFLKWF